MPVSVLPTEPDPRPKHHAPPMVNGSSPLQVSVTAQERDETVGAIERTFRAKRPVDLDQDDSDEDEEDEDDATSPTKRRKTVTQRTSPPRASRTRSRLSGPARDARDAAPGQPSPATSRAVSPYTNHPPIDYNGLSWPSEFPTITLIEG